MNARPRRTGRPTSTPSATSTGSPTGSSSSRCCAGSYPADVLDDLQHITDWSFIRDGDPALINAPIDVLGINYYSPAMVAATTPELRRRSADGGSTTRTAPRPIGVPRHRPGLSVPQDGPYTAMGWPIEPSSLPSCCVRVHRDYPELPLMITENGAAFDDEVAADGAVHDADRIGYLHAHLGAVHDAIAARASTFAATSSGRCWTTSSGRSATPSASASCAWTTRPARGW